MKHSWLENFDLILYVNMDSSNDRRIHMRKMLREAGVYDKVVRVPATTPDTLGERELHNIIELNRFTDDKEKAYYKIVDDARRIEVCCAHSHYKALTYAINEYNHRNKQNRLLDNANVRDDLKVLIMEDDMQFLNQQGALEMFDDLPKDWDVFYPYYFIFGEDPGRYCHKQGYHINLRQINSNIAQAYAGTYATGCYAINIKSDFNCAQFELLANEMRNGAIADALLSSFNHLNRFIPRHRFMMPMGFDSTIGEDSSYGIDAQAKYCPWEMGNVRGSFDYDYNNMLNTKIIDGKSYAYIVRVEKSGERKIDSRSHHYSSPDYAKWIDCLVKDTITYSEYHDYDTVYLVHYGDKSNPNKASKTYYKKNSKLQTLTV